MLHALTLLMQSIGLWVCASILLTAFVATTLFEKKDN